MDHPLPLVAVGALARDRRRVVPLLLTVLALDKR